MKIKNLMFAGLAILGLAACSNDNTDVLSDGENQAYDAYLTVSLKVPESATRAQDEVGTSDESKIEKIQVYLVSDGKIRFARETTLAEGVLTTEAFNVGQGEYKVFVVANPNSGSLQLVGANINTEVIRTTNSLIGDNGDRFYMSSAVTVANAGIDGGTPVSINETHSTAQTAAHITVSVDRLAAKVVNKTENSVPVATDEPSNPSPLANIKDKDGNLFFGSSFGYLGMSLANTNKFMNLFQVWENSTNGNLQGKYIKTPQGTIQGHQGSDPDIPAGLYIGYDNILPLFTNSEGIVQADLFEKEGPFYVAENRPEFITNNKLTAGMAKTTAAVYKFKAADATFYYVGGVIYTSISDIAALDQFKDKGLTESTKVNELRALGIKVYKDGEMYYSYFIKDNISVQ